MNWNEVIRREKSQAAAWLAEHHAEIPPVIEGPETGVPDAMRADTLGVLTFDHGGWHMPCTCVMPFVSLLVKARTSPSPAIATRDVTDAPVYDRDDAFFRPGLITQKNGKYLEESVLAESEAAIRRRLFPRKRTCFGMVVYLLNRLKLWEWAKTKYTVMFYRNQLQDCDGRLFPSGPRAQWSEGHSNKERYQAHRLLYPLTGPEKIATRVHYDAFPRNRRHPLADHGAENITHRCTDDCTCDLDWRMWQHWRPWQEPFGGLSGVLESELWETIWPLGTGKLTLFLKRILWEHKGTEPQRPGWRYKDWRSVDYFMLTTPQRPNKGPKRRRAGFHLLLEVKGGKPWRVRYWEQFFHAAKAQQIADSPGDFFAPANILQHLDVIVTTSRSKQYVGICVDLSHTILRRTVREKRVLYKDTHDSAADVMRYLGCSRATAFRRIKEGFRIPTSQLTTQTHPR